jgi:O-antigen/teichoic acid export membrane protein
MTSKPTPQNTNTIARNAFWYGLEIGIALIAAFGVSVAVARAIGPQKLGYYLYITWLANISTTVGVLGIPLSTRKYMAEYLGKGDGASARAIFFTTFRLQFFVATVVTTIGMVLVFTVSDPAYRLSSALLVAALLPRMIISVPSQANMAAENLRANVPASILNNIITIVMVAVSLTRGWGLAGVAGSMLAGHVAEVITRTIPVLRWVRKLPAGVLPPELRSRMVSFSSYGMVLMLLNAVVWDRSDLVFLKALCPDIRQVSFFSVAFNVSEKMLLIPQTFAHAVGASIMAQFGRDQKRLLPMVATAGRYVFLCAVPLLMGAAALSGPLMRLVYGWQYLPAIPVLAVACVLAIPKSLLLPAQHLLQTTENQKFLVVWGIACAVLNVSLDLLLIPRHAALGAALANGGTQLVAMLGIWVCALKLFPLDMRWGGLAKILLSSAVMVGAVVPVAWFLPPLVALCIGFPLGAAVFITMLRLTASFQAADRERLAQLRHHFPGRLVRGFDWLVSWVAPQPAQ